MIGIALFILFPIVFSKDFRYDLSVFRVPPFQKDFLSHILLLVFFWVNIYVLIPRYFEQKKYVYYFVFITLIYFIISFLPEFVIGFQPHFEPHSHPMGHQHPPHDESPHQGLGLIVHNSAFRYLFVIAISFIIINYQKLKSIEEEKISLELDFLKAQINPHFLFNTLNGIYKSSVEENAKHTGCLILKLSELLRYHSVESLDHKIKLSDEIKFIEDYIELQKQRLQQSVEITFRNNVQTSHLYQIAPTICINIIENAFKYGVNPERNSKIDIRMDLQNSDFTLYVQNNVVNENEASHQIGLNNTLRRLEIMYPQRHNLSIDKNNDIFEVKLTMNLV